MTSRPKRVLLLQAHPDPAGRHFGHALAQRYGDAARAAGHTVETVNVATLDFPLLRSKRDWEEGALPPVLRPVQQAIERAEHLVFFFPLWLGGMPALLKGLLEQVARPGFAMAKTGGPAGFRKLLGGRSARLVVTMGMPALVYRMFFLAHGVRQLERSILRFVGIAPVRETLIGNVEGSASSRERWLVRMERLGQRAV
jgi:putative NADPH-quinone reductase